MPGARKQVPASDVKRLPAQEKASGPEPITLLRQFNALVVSPHVDPLLRVLQARCHNCGPGRDGAFRVVRTSVPLYERKGHGLYCSAALEPVVRAVLEKAGYPVRLAGQEFGELPAPRLDRLEVGPPRDVGVLEFIRQKDKGLVRFDPKKLDRGWLIAQAAWAWPKKTIAVVARRIKDVRFIRNRLACYRVRACAITSRNRPAVGKIGRVVVGTPFALTGEPLVDFEWRDMVFAWDAMEALGSVDYESLDHAWRARIYGFLPLGVEPSPLASDLIANLFGFEEVTVPEHGHRERPVQVVFERIEGGRKFSLDADILAIKRKGVWHNAVRNRRIARLVRFLIERNWPSLQEQFPQVAASLAGRSQPGVLVVVENKEHGRILSHQLPGSPFSHHCFTMGDVKGIEMARVDVLIRADGGVGLPPWPRGILVEPNDFATAPLILVDFKDRHHPELSKRSRQRREAYWAHGWHRPGVDPVEARVHRFLATRPGRANCER